MEKTILLDLDGVLADFFGACCSLFGVDTESFYASLTPESGWNFYRHWGLNESGFWQHIDRFGEEFWAYLGTYPHSKNLYDHCRSLAKVRFATSAPMAPHAWSGKVRWIHSFTGDCRFHNIDMTNDKGGLAQPHRLLVDDSDANVEAFRAAGGSAILYPRPWNKRHADEARAAELVMDEITQWAKS